MTGTQPCQVVEETDRSPPEQLECSLEKCQQVYQQPIEGAREFVNNKHMVVFFFFFLFFSICNLFLSHFRVFLFPHLYVYVCVQSVCAVIVPRAGWSSRILVTSCLKTAWPGRRAGRNARGREEILPSSLMNVCRSVNLELWSNKKANWSESHLNVFLCLSTISHLCRCIWAGRGICTTGLG